MPFKKGISGNIQGRNKGIPNKITQNVRESIQAFIECNTDTLQATFDQLEPKDKIKYYIDLLPFIVPKLQSTQLDVQNVMIGVELEEYIVNL